MSSRVDARQRFGPRSISLEKTSEAVETANSPRGTPPAASATEAKIDFRTLYEAHAQFVWLTLQRVGVRRGDLDDLCHDVFMVVHARLPEYSNTGIRSWLFAISIRLAANYRRKAYVRLEKTIGSFDHEERSVPLAPDSASPERVLAQRQALGRAQAALSRLPPVQRVVFMMFEIEGIACDEIAKELGVAVGTVYSRLHAARKMFRSEAKRLAQEQGGNSND